MNDDQILQPATLPDVALLLGELVAGRQFLPGKVRVPLIAGEIVDPSPRQVAFSVVW